MHASHVLIRGHVFTYEEKAPFVASGKSVLGAIEYDKEKDRLKCHECGELFASIGGHIKIHGVSAEDYKTRHGLSHQGTDGSLNNLARRQMLSEHQKSKIASLGAANPLANYKSPGPKRGARPRLGMRNLESRCEAQLLFRLQLLAAELGHTPTSREVTAAGIPLGTMRFEFQTLSKAMELAGLVPNTHGYQNGEPSPLPNGFPSEEELNEARMPWPKEYFTPTVPRSSSPLA